MDEQELAAQYQKYGYMVYRRCLTLLGNRVDADDAMQETFLRAQRSPRADTAPSPLGWLYTIAAHCSYDLMKKQRRAEPVAPEAVAKLDPRTIGSARDADDKARVGAALRRLDARTRQIGLLHHLGGFTQEEVAVETGLSRRTIGKKLQRFAEALGKPDDRGETP